jgi:gamma-glutamylcyclotransferase (GGCT)/AIG2-like uncharacterized protein YtfP
MKFLVYGTLKQAFGNHRILHEGRATFLGKAVTLGKFVMTGQGVPFVWPHEEGYPLVGELYDIGTPNHDMTAAQTLGRLDRLESNGYVYNRQPHSVRVISGPDGIMPLPRDSGDVHDEVWIYECMGDRYYPKPKPTDEAVLHCLNLETGWLEWEAERSRKPMAWGKPRPVQPWENIGSTTRDERARPLDEVLREDE